MEHQLNFINHDHILLGIKFIDINGIPSDNIWNEYWIVYNGKTYPYKYTVEKASTFTNTPIKTRDFTSNESSRKYISSLGFNIQFIEQTASSSEPKFWIGATYYGNPPNQQDMYTDFFKNGYWKTDHDLSNGIGLGIYNLLKNVKVNDRIALRYFSRKKSTTDIIAIGTIKDLSEIINGKLYVVWDYKPILYKGKIPEGVGAGNWWNTFFELKRQEDIYFIFNYGASTKRISRLTWNDNGYISPSGPIGKSKDKKTHEGKFGYGHEEWLFDNSKLIDGYHYGFLEPIRKHQDGYIGKAFEIWLYTINADTGLRYWVGEIKNIEVIDALKASEIKTIYESNGWMEEMKNQIKSSLANSTGFSEFNGLDIFNIRYLPENLKVNDPYFELPQGHPINNITRYSLVFMKHKFMVPEADKSSPFTFQPPTHISEGTSKQPKKKLTVREPKGVEIIYLHRAISDNLTVKLREIYGDLNVNPEHTAGYGQNRIDIVVKNDSGLIFYEIKTYNSLMTSIREAFGQLMEYAYWPNQKKAKKLIIVTQQPISPEGELYFQHLRTTLKLPIFYQSYDLEQGILSIEK